MLPIRYRWCTLRDKYPVIFWFYFSTFDFQVISISNFGHKVEGSWNIQFFPSYLRRECQYSTVYLQYVCFNFISPFQVFRARTPSDAISLTSKLLEYTPGNRYSPLEACAHVFFDELRMSGIRLPNDKELPELFNFTAQGEKSENTFLLNLLLLSWKVSPLTVNP